MHLLHKAHGEFCHLLRLNISSIKPSNIQTMRTPFRLLVAVAALGLAFGLTLTACARTQHNLKNTNTMNDTATLYFAGGCFWGTEHFFKQINGVLDTRVGYANGHVENPTYEQVCEHQTGFAETVEVKYDPQRLPLTLLVQLFFRTIDPTSVNRQGGDVGPQYRTGIYYTDPALRPLLVAEKAKLAAAIGRPVAVEVEPLHNFYAAEDYHQDYLDVHPGGYCHVPSALFEEARRANADALQKNTYRKPTDEELRRRLTDVQYSVTQKAATEAPHQNAYDKEFRPGIYVDITTGEPLFLSTDKFESGCGWPALPTIVTACTARRCAANSAVPTSATCSTTDRKLPVDCAIASTVLRCVSSPKRTWNARATARFSRYSKHRRRDSTKPYLPVDGFRLPLAQTAPRLPDEGRFAFRGCAE